VTPKQERFVEEYLIDLNATQAAIRAGYKPKRAYSTGNENLKKPEIQEAITKAQVKRSQRTEITADRVLRELARIAFVDLRRVFKWGPDGVALRPSDELTEDEAAIVAEVSETTTESGGSIKVKRFDKLKALELLMKHLGLLVDRTEVTGKDGGAIEVKSQKADLSRLTDEELEAYAELSAKARGDTAASARQ
jgi:phage terminase small subunit